MWFSRTSVGPLAFEGSGGLAGPVLLAILGAFPERGHLEELAALSPNYVRSFLPGFFCPSVADASAPALSRAYDEAIALTFAGREVVVVGLSAGGVVALGLTAPEVRKLIVVEPFLSNRRLDPLIRYLRARWGDYPASQQAFARQFFGFSERGVDAREFPVNYRGELTVIHGDQAAAGGGYLPSLTSPEDLATLKRCSAILRPQGGGHGPSANFLPAIGAALLQADLADHDKPVAAR